MPTMIFSSAQTSRNAGEISDRSFRKELAKRLIPPIEHPSDVEDLHVSSGAEDDVVKDASNAEDSGDSTESLQVTSEMTTKLREHFSTWQRRSRPSWRCGSSHCSKTKNTRSYRHGYPSHWEARIDKVDNYWDQKTARSYGLSRLRNLRGLSEPLATAFMLVDMAEVDWPAERPQAADVKKVRSKLRRLPSVTACDEASKELIGFAKEDGAGPAAQDMMAQTFERQICFLGEITNSPSSFDHWSEVHTLEALWTRVIIQGHGDPAIDQGALDFWRSKRNNIINQDTARRLMLNEWQVRALLLPGAKAKILTDWQ